MSPGHMVTNKQEEGEGGETNCWNVCEPIVAPLN